MLDRAYRRGEYDSLYPNYLRDTAFDRHVELLVSESPLSEGEFAVDLCAGTGWMTRLLMRLGVFVVAFDKHQKMLDQLRRHIDEERLQRQEKASSHRSWAIQADLNRRNWERNVKSMFWSFGKMSGLRLITCRQGAGNLTREALLRIPHLLDNGGIFTFNTFARPRWFRYRRQGNIREFGMCFFGRVFHAQCLGWKVDVTTFRWHDTIGLIRHWEAEGFIVGLGVTGRTHIVTVHKAESDVRQDRSERSEAASLPSHQPPN